MVNTARIFNARAMSDATTPDSSASRSDSKHRITNTPRRCPTLYPSPAVKSLQEKLTFLFEKRKVSKRKTEQQSFICK